MGVAVNLAVANPKELSRLRPMRRRGGIPADEDDFDETGLAEELASLGFYEVKADG